MSGFAQSSEFIISFPTHSSARIHYHNMKRLPVAKNGCVRADIDLPNCLVNRTGCFTCPFKLVRNILSSEHAKGEIILFHINKKDDFFVNL